MAKNNAAYWAQRMKNLMDAMQDQSYEYVENIEHQFTIAQTEVERKLAIWYQRLADNNEISLAEAKKLLMADELKEFHWTVEEYIEYGRKNALDKLWMKELENASAKVHISRLEFIKLQLQQQAEVLYSNQLDALDDMIRKVYEDGYYHTAFEIQKGIGVGYTMQAINDNLIEKVMSRPWTVDGQTFRDRCWTNKQSLVNSVNTQLTQMIIRGEAPDRAIAAISKQFGVGKRKAGRLVMTESAYFANEAQKDCFADLGVERYKVAATLDSNTCDLCGDMDGQVFEMSEHQAGLTAPPFHPWCRCCTAPYFEDLEDIGERWARNPDGSTKKVPANTTFSEWKEEFIKDDHSELSETESSGKIKEKEILTKEEVIEKAKKLAESSHYDNVRSFQELRAITNAQIGYDGLPDVVSAEEYERLSKAKTKLYRGVHSGNGKTAAEIAKEFKYGELWTGSAGGSVYGNGVYFTATESIASREEYAGAAGEIIEAILKDDAKVADYVDIMQEYEEIYKLRRRSNEAYLQIIGDVGQYAAVKGYDAIALNGFHGHDYVILLNRTKAIVKE